MAEKIYFENFNNIYKFMDVIEKRPNNKKFGKSSQKNGDWSGTKTYSEAVEQFSNGLPETAERLKESLGQFKAKANIQTPRRILNNHYYGYSPNVPAAIIGLPKSMRRIEKHPQKIKTIGILWDCCQNCDYEADTLREAGETVLKLVFALELKGYRVSLDGIPFNGDADENRKVCVLINLKKYGQPMDILKLSFPVTSPAMFRRFGFKWAEGIPDFSGGKVYGYGHTMDKDRLLEILSKNGIDTKSMYCINVNDCESAEFDPMQVAKNLGIVL